MYGKIRNNPTAWSLQSYILKLVLFFRSSELGLMHQFMSSSVAFKLEYIEDHVLVLITQNSTPPDGCGSYPISASPETDQAVILSTTSGCSNSF